MLQDAIRAATKAWLSTPDCPARAAVDYMRTRGALREPQLEAIEVYLFLKMKGRARPLPSLFAEGFFTSALNLDAEPLPAAVRQQLDSNVAARALYDFAKANEASAPELLAHLRSGPDDLDATAAIRAIFYNTPYPDYLFSLPMGAGKTFLMAAFIYLDLYFASLAPDDPVWARNFIILAPSSTKSSILPSLRTIESFDPTWVIPEPAATETKRRLRFEVLDAAKTGKKSNKARNPNAQKVASYQPFEDCTGLVLVTNAEKVILDHVAQNAQGEIFTDEGDDAGKAANELRRLIGKLPALQIHIDEVHRAATDNIKLRAVVGGWAASGTVNTVLGYSGTPYLEKPEPVSLGGDFTARFGQITTTVYYYPLAQAVQTFLKKPDIRSINGATSLDIVHRGTEEFLERYGTKQYSNGATAKLAIYCGGVRRAEEVILPHLTGVLGVPREDILVYHGGDDVYKISADAEERWRTLDRPENRTRIILLVQIGKEGWDCRSLTGVILSQKGDTPRNMVLQASTRCLREMDGCESTALIRMNEENFALLDKQLRQDQHISVAELNLAAATRGTSLVPRTSRAAHLPAVRMHQLRVRYTDAVPEPDARTAEKLAGLLADDAAWGRDAVETRRNATLAAEESVVFSSSGWESAEFGSWLAAVRREGAGFPAYADLMMHRPLLQAIFERCVFERDGRRLYNNLVPQAAIRARVRTAFQVHIGFDTREELFAEDAELLLVGKLTPVEEGDTLYPSPADRAIILDLDARGLSGDAAGGQAREEYERTVALLRSQGLGHMADAIPEPKASPAVAAKDRALHYLPYEFRQSALERRFYEAALTEAGIRARGLELYFNGENYLTDFQIRCYEKRDNGGWKPLHFHYTPDFLLLSRDEAGEVHKAVIIETKGRGFGDADAFVKRRRFVEEHFVPMNNQQAGYPRFDFLYLPEETETQHLSLLAKKVETFFAPVADKGEMRSAVS